MTAIRMKIDMAGLFHNRSGVKRGDVIQVPGADAARYLMHGYAQPADLKELGPPYVPVRTRAIG